MQCVGPRTVGLTSVGSTVYQLIEDFVQASTKWICCIHCHLVSLFFLGPDSPLAVDCIHTIPLKRISASFANTFIWMWAVHVTLEVTDQWDGAVYYSPSFWCNNRCAHNFSLCSNVLKLLVAVSSMLSSGSTLKVTAFNLFLRRASSLCVHCILTRIYEHALEVCTACLLHIFGLFFVVKICAHKWRVLVA